MTTVLDATAFSPGFSPTATCVAPSITASTFMAPASPIMTRAQDRAPDMLAAEAMLIMDQRISTLVVVDHDAHPIGVIHLHDLLRAGIA